MSHDIDLKFLDKTEILQKIFPMTMNLDFNDIPQSDPNADAYFVDVTEDVRLCCKFYCSDSSCPSVLYFHGNDETALKQSDLGSRFIEMGINLFVTDYRGYGISDGTPTMTNLFQDCHKIWKFFKKFLKKDRYNPEVFLMGRSLGSLPAVELAYHYPVDFKGLILESSSAMNFKSAWGNVDTAEVKRLNAEKFFNKDKIKEITMPTLVIHGDADPLMPIEIGKAMYELSAAKDKKLVVIAGGGHNNLRDIGYDEYYQAIEDFINKKKKLPRKAAPVKAKKVKTGTIPARKSASTKAVAVKKTVKTRAAVPKKTARTAAKKRTTRGN